MSTSPVKRTARTASTGGALARRPVEGATPTRILDAAWSCFVERGISATTMEQIARRAGISRVWLYRHFPNRDAIVRALVERETARFLDGMAARLDPDAPGDAPVGDAFVYALAFLREHDLLNRLLATEPQMLLPFITVQAGPLLRSATEMAVPLLRVRLGLEDADAALVAEALVRLVASCVLTRTVAADLDDEATARRVVALLTSPPSGPLVPSRRRSRR